MIFGGSIDLYLLVEKRLKGQRLGNVGLNVDEKQKREKRKAHGPKASRGSFFFQTLKEGKKLRKGKIFFFCKQNQKNNMGRHGCTVHIGDG